MMGKKKGCKSLIARYKEYKEIQSTYKKTHDKNQSESE